MANHMCDYDQGDGNCYWRDAVVPRLEAEKAALLEALENVVKHPIYNSTFKHDLDAARAAIAQARGDKS